MDWLLTLLSTEWFLGFLSGVAATILGFVLTMMWDIRKMRRESLERDKIVMNAIKEEVLANKQSIAQNLAWLQHEIAILAEDKTMTQPLVLMKTGFWDLAKVNLPKDLLVGNRLARLRDLGFLTEYVNESIRSRENYRIHNEAMNNYKDRLHTADELLIKNLQNLAGELDVYEKDDLRN